MESKSQCKAKVCDRAKGQVLACADSSGDATLAEAHSGRQLALGDFQLTQEGSYRLPHFSEKQLALHLTAIRVLLGDLAPHRSSSARRGRRGPPARWHGVEFPARPCAGREPSALRDPRRYRERVYVIRVGRAA